MLFMMNHNLALVEKALRDGHAIAAKLKKATSDEEINRLEKEIKTYGDFVDETFGKIDEDDALQEHNCELSFLLYLATESKRVHMYYAPHQNESNNYKIEEFEEYLDSKSWL